MLVSLILRNRFVGILLWAVPDSLLHILLLCSEIIIKFVFAKENGIITIEDIACRNGKRETGGIVGDTIKIGISTKSVRKYFLRLLKCHSAFRHLEYEFQAVSAWSDESKSQTICLGILFKSFKEWFRIIYVIKVEWYESACLCRLIASLAICEVGVETKAWQLSLELLYLILCVRQLYQLTYLVADSQHLLAVDDLPERFVRAGLTLWTYWPAEVENFSSKHFFS